MYGRSSFIPGTWFQCSIFYAHGLDFSRNTSDGKSPAGLDLNQVYSYKPCDVITGKISDNGSKDQKRGLTVWIHGKWRVFCGKYKIDTFFKICNIFWYFTRPCHIFRDPIKLTHAAPPTHLWEYPAVPVTAAALTPKQLFEKNLVGNMEVTHHMSTSVLMRLNLSDSNMRVESVGPWVFFRGFHACDSRLVESVNYTFFPTQLESQDTILWRKQLPWS